MSKTNYLIHPHEVSFCGFSNSGKTTLIEKLVKHFSKKHRLSYFKHDAHQFTMDKEGKDTDRIYKAGADQIFINDSNHSALVGNVSEDLYQRRSLFLDSELVFIEGHKKSDSPKFVFIDKERKIFNEVNPESVLAYIRAEDDPNDLLLDRPVFDRNDTAGLIKFLDSYFLSKIENRKLNALILAGGKSSRMGKDKGALEYHGKPQVQFLKEILAPFCDDVFVSCRNDQIEKSHLSVENLITDRFLDMGPLGGISSALMANQNCGWLVVACDLPYLNKESIETLIQHRNPYKLATTFMNYEVNRLEPLCSIYEPHIFPRMMQYLGQFKTCPQKVLRNSNVELLDLGDRISLENVNTPSEFNLAMNRFEGATE